MSNQEKAVVPLGVDAKETVNLLPRRINRPSSSNLKN